MQWPLGSAERRRNASMAWEVVQQGPNFCARLPHRWWTLPTKRMILPTLNGNFTNKHGEFTYFTNKHGEFTIFYQQTWWVYHILPTNMVSLPYFTNKHGEFTIFYQQTWSFYQNADSTMNNGEWSGNNDDFTDSTKKIMWILPWQIGSSPRTMIV